METPFEHIVAWGRHYEQEELRKQDEKELSELLYEKLAKDYANYIIPELELLTEAKKKALTESLKKFHDFCAGVGMDIRCLPASVGVVASFLHCERTAGATYTAIKKHAEAISYFHELNESWDPCKDELIKAILRSANPRGRLSDNEDQN
jgi:hypothetical protein